MTDVILVCGGKDFPANKAILSEASRYFRAMFSPGWDESKSTRINLPTVGTDEMEIILHFLQTREFKDVNDAFLLEALLATSHFLQINDLFEHCYKKISERLSCQNFLDICNLAFQYNDEGMIAHVLNFLAGNFEGVANSKEFLKLNECQMQKICQHPNILRATIDVVLNGLFQWTEVDHDRDETLLHILATFDRQCMSTAFLPRNLRERALINKNYHILTLLPDEESLEIQPSSSKNPNNSNQPTLLIFGQIAHYHVFRKFDIKQNKWSLPQILPFKLERGMSTVLFAGHVYVFGGCGLSNRSTKLSSKVMKFCPETNTIVSFGTISVPVIHAGTGVLSKYIYAVNGIDEKSQRLSIVQRYNPETETSEMMAHTNNPHFWPHVLPFDKYLFVMGSNDNNVERYDSECDNWTSITVIPGEIRYPRAAIYKEKLFVIPVLGTSEFHIYDLLSGTWEQSQFEGSPTRIYGLSSVMSEGKCILLVHDGVDAFHSFDPNSGRWMWKTYSRYEPFFHRHSCVIYICCDI